MASEPWTGKTVLIVDDSDAVRAQLAGIYSDLGMRVGNFAKNGIEAIGIYEQTRPDFVSLDIVMPEMHGIDCYRRLMAIEPGLNFLFVSCLGADPAVITAFEGKIPANRFLGKPVTYESMHKALLGIYSAVAALPPADLHQSSIKNVVA
jgi:two-component system chemotaxis response regulator CheY